MNRTTKPPPPPDFRIPTPEKTLRRLFLTLFLRGRAARGLQKGKSPKSIGSKLTLMLITYAFVGGIISMNFMRLSIFATSLYLHSATMVFLGMFIAASSGEVLFNKDEADILMHRPVTPRAMLWAKVSVMVQISLWLAGALNLVGCVVGITKADPGWLFPLVHAASITCEALFCTGGIVMIYQLCLRWFGREKMEGIMTTMQVVVAVGVVSIGQIGPRLARSTGMNLGDTNAWWMRALPPAWFAGIDDALCGSHSMTSLALGGVGVVVTAVVLWLAFGRLARSYEVGLQSLNEARAAAPSRGGRRRFIDKLVHLPPLSWWLRDSVARASFLLTAAYLMRDRDVKLRMYPGIAPMMVMPFIFLLQDSHSFGGGAGESSGFFSGFSIAFAGAYLGFIPFLALKIIRYSQQWQASDLFRVAPMAGPAQLCHGARRAILLFLTLPVMIVFGAAVYFLGRNSGHLPMFIPGVIILPIYALIPCMGGDAVPLSVATEEGKAARNVAAMYAVMLISAAVAAATTLAWHYGFFNWFLLGEIIVVTVTYILIRSSLSKARWSSIE